jgi:hypothetical protein
MPKSSRLGLLRNQDFGRLFAATALGQLGDRIIFLTPGRVAGWCMGGPNAEAIV